jgi:hypothetical protein
MQDKNHSDNSNKDYKFNGTEEGYNRYKIGLSILAILVFMIILLVFQLISYITDQDILAPFPGLNFIITPICFLITLTAMYFIEKSTYMTKILNHMNKLLIWIEKHPIIYNILKFAFKHPIILGIIIGIISALVENIITLFAR